MKIRFLLMIGVLVVLAGFVFAPAQINNPPFGTAPILQPVGSAVAPSYSFIGHTNTGLFIDGSNNLIMFNGASGAQIAAGAGNSVSFSTGNTSALLTSGAGFEAPTFISTGTKFTTNNGCGETTNLVGGASAGKITTSGSTTCTTIVTFGTTGTGTTAPNGWACTAHDLTTAGSYNNPHASSSTTTVTIVTGTIVAGDVIEFGCTGY